jgi:hypothetical protein
MCRVAGIEALGGEYKCPGHDPPARATRWEAVGTEEFEGWTRMELSLLVRRGCRASARFSLTFAFNSPRMPPRWER